MFVADYVRPGTVYADEPSESVPVGWHVRLELTEEQRLSPEWADDWWPSVYAGDRDVDHVHAVVIAKVANDRWDRDGRVPALAEQALRDAINELSGTPL